MQLIYSIEDIRKTWPELAGLTTLHRIEVRGDEDESAPNQEFYNNMTADGRLLFFTVRESETKRLVGYATIILSTDNQREGDYCAHQDAVFINKPYRRGFAGVRLFKYIERECAARGVNRIYQSVTPANDFSPILERIGYTESTKIYAKYIGGHGHG